MKRKHRRIKKCIIEYIEEVYCRSVIISFILSTLGAYWIDGSTLSMSLLYVLGSYIIIAVPIIYYMALKEAENMED